MLLRCPSCSARYEIAPDGWPIDEAADGSLLMRPRKVRCRRCQEVWLATPEAEDEILDPGPPLADPIPVAAPASVAAPVPAFFANRLQPAAVAPEPVAQDSPHKPRRLWPWLLAATLAGGALYAAVATNRLDPEAYGLPPLAPWATLDATALDLPSFDLPALSLPAISVPAVSVPQAAAPRLTLKTRVQKEPIPGGGTVWSITGSVTNPTGTRQDLPPIELELLGAEGIPLTRWSIRPPAQTLGPGKTIAFETTALNPPAEAAKVRIMLKPASLARL